nr:helix-turn-helix domain-containing protein [Alteromonas macleodii]
MTDVAQHLDVSRKTLSKVLNGKGAITPEMALRLELAFGYVCKMLLIYGKRGNIKVLYMSTPYNLAAV